MRVDARQAHDILVRDGTILSDRQVRTSNNSHHHYDYIHRPRNDIIRCPHHIPLSDGEWGPDRDLQIRAPYQVRLFFIIYFLFYSFDLNS